MAIMSIQAMKGVGIGDGFDLAGRVGSEAHDEIFYSEEQGFFRETNRAGGIEGGMTTGDPVVVSGAMKPLPTLTKPLRSVDLETKEPAAGAARADRLVHGAGRRRDRRGDGGAGAGRRATARSSAATTSTTPWPRSPRTRSGSDGGADERARLHRLHGRRQVQLGALGGRGARPRAARLRPRAGGASWASRSRRSSTARASRRSARARRRRCCACSSARTAAWWRSAAARPSPSACARRCATTPSCTSRWSPRRRGGAPRARAARSRATAAASTSCTRIAPRCTTRSPTP